jgi:hypothetical protein
MGRKIRKYTWNMKCELCNYTWKNDVPYYRHSGEVVERQCPYCGYKFFYREDYIYFDKDDELIFNTDDTEGV